MDPQQALARLREGNDRFISGTGRSTPITAEQVAAVADGQQPFATILGCADSRVPVEIVFDQGLGDLFVIRVAGAVVLASQVGSAEYAASHLGSSLLVVLGHTSCGAVQSALDVLNGGVTPPTEGLRAIVDQLRPAIEPVVQSGVDDRLRAAVEAGVRSSVEALRDGSRALRDLEDQGSLQIVGAVYDLATGEVRTLQD
ncbi:MAG: carbonic anhydrase, partial [Actinomycetota bacterium]